MPLSKIVANSIADDTITTDQIADTSVNGRRNLIINPSGAVDQRGGSSTINTYSVDRWRSFGGPGGFTISKRTDAGEGDGNAIRFHRTASNSQTSAMGIAQGIETRESKRLAGKTVTISFRARKGADWSPTNFDAKVYHGTGTDENPVGMTGQASNIAVDDASLTPSFQTFVGNVTIPSNKTQVTLGFQWTPSGTAGANDYVDIREIQMEVGEVSSPVFEHRSFGEEMALCQRYFFREGNVGEALHYVTTGPTGGQRWYFQALPVQMRKDPTDTIYADNSQASSGKCRRDDNTLIDITGSYTSQDTIGFLITNGTANNLFFHDFDVDAEL